MKRKRIEEMSYRNISDQHAMDEFKDRCNERPNALWKNIDALSKQIDTLPEGESKEYHKLYIDLRSEC